MSAFGSSRGRVERLNGGAKPKGRVEGGGGRAALVESSLNGTQWQLALVSRLQTLFFRTSWLQSDAGANAGLCLRQRSIVVADQHPDDLTGIRLLFQRLP